MLYFTGDSVIGSRLFKKQEEVRFHVAAASPSFVAGQRDGVDSISNISIQTTDNFKIVEYLVLDQMLAGMRALSVSSPVTCVEELLIHTSFPRARNRRVPKLKDVLDSLRSFWQMWAGKRC